MGRAFWLSWEPEIIVFLQSKVTPTLQKFYEAVTFLGDVYALILIIGFIYWGYKKDFGKKISYYAISALLVSTTLNNIVKRRRPYFDHEDIKCLKPRTDEGDPYDSLIQGYSFPSGHATDSVSTYGVLGIKTKNKLLKVIFFLLPIIIGLSRLVLGVHYPTDILAGWIISSLMILIISRINNKKIIYVIIVSVGIIGCFFSRSADYYSVFGIALGFVVGFSYEEKYVNFDNTKNVWFMILRTIVGLVSFLVLDTILKLPFSESFLATTTNLSLLVRTVRYAICSFVLMGIYPKLFSVVDEKIINKRKH